MNCSMGALLWSHRARHDHCCCPCAHRSKAGAHRCCWGDPTAELPLPSAALGFLCFKKWINKNFLWAFFPPNVEASQIIFPCVVSDENTFLPFFLSVKRNSGKIVEYYSKTLFFLPRLALYFGLMPRFSVADDSYWNRHPQEKQSNFLKINLVLFLYLTKRETPYA